MDLTKMLQRKRPLEQLSPWHLYLEQSGGPRIPTGCAKTAVDFSPLPYSHAWDLDCKGQTSFLGPQALPLAVLTRQLFEKTELNRSVTRDKNHPRRL
ncbi:hypothetical protein [Rhizobium sp.]|uniref:hypothetical protein n=1 Tax=Rhizobium sp. TaxID=391 RepID=UPI002F06234A